MRAVTCQQPNDRKRDQLNARSIDDNEKHHLESYRVIFGIEGLEVFHGLDAQRRGRITQSEEVGQQIERDRSYGRVAFRYVSEEKRDCRSKEI